MAFFFPEPEDVVDEFDLQSRSRSDLSGPSLWLVLPVPQNVGLFCCCDVEDSDELDEHDEAFPEFEEEVAFDEDDVDVDFTDDGAVDDGDENGFCSLDFNEPTSLVAGEMDMAELGLPEGET